MSNKQHQQAGPNGAVLPDDVKKNFITMQSHYEGLTTTPHMARRHKHDHHPQSLQKADHAAGVVGRNETVSEVIGQITYEIVTG